MMSARVSSILIKRRFKELKNYLFDPVVIRAKRAKVQELLDRELADWCKVLSIDQVKKELITQGPKPHN